MTNITRVLLNILQIEGFIAAILGVAVVVIFCLGVLGFYCLEAIRHIIDAKKDEDSEYSEDKHD